MPIVTTAAVPSPDHMAYATPIGIDFTACDRKTNDSTYPVRTATVGRAG